jgi:hypothetical protein
MSHSINIELLMSPETEVATPADLRGGIKILVGDRRLNRYKNEDGLQFANPWRPEFAGNDIYSDMSALVAVANTLVSDGMSIYKSHELQLAGLSSYFVFERLCATTTRVAFRTHQSNEEHGPHPRSACGYPVETAELAAEIVSTGDEYMEEVNKIDFTSTFGISEFEAVLQETRIEL